MAVRRGIIRVVENLTPASLSRCKQRGLHTSHSGAVLIDGLTRAKEIQKLLKREVFSLQEQGYLSPQLVTVLVGNNNASHIYVRNKMIAAAEVGISANLIHLKSSVPETELIDLIKSLNADSNVHAILVQLPLPNHMSKLAICNIIDPLKDVDGFSFSNLGNFFLGLDTLWPCTALAVCDLIRSTGIDTKGKSAVVCGRSKHVGLPIALALQSPEMDATTSICHRFTSHQQLCDLTRKADILVSATGVPKLITSDMVKPGACVIDVGITRVQGTKATLVGDVDFKEVKNIAGYLTPVPGGVGPMTVAMLMKNTVRAARYQVGLDK
ncbi:Bifunctional methylenetetrahydrofolate dehydrogenase/cyclohydrolase, mitochondrial [Frankliniella fusca]|uniref:methenyltetrahydrofolate cyclohydrolase n=1 Tax=Frankliniella fusca TaxID=407009 RepID=A0AAE1HWL3_9NEOP|nr:Bifunctional methylenetetrahydrofolate dehydrogenase/cyclohydrolase, mitochondrial [Frankliniella fusca]